MKKLKELALKFWRSRFGRDLLERVFWTTIQGALSVLTVELADLPAVYAPVIMAALAGLKGYVAKKVGDQESASLSRYV